MPLARKRTTATATGTARRRTYARASTRSARAAGFLNTRLGWSMANPEQPLPGPRRSYQRPELKFFDTPLVSTWNGSGGPTTVTVVNQPPQGVTSSDRLGNSISNRSLEMVGAISRGTAQITNQTCRLLVVWDHQPDPAGVPTPINPSLLTLPTPDGLMNITNSDRYTILYDKLFSISANIANPKADKPLHIYLSLKGVESKHTTGGTFPTSNSLCIYTIGDTPAGVNTNPFWIAQARIRYTDS